MEQPSWSEWTSGEWLTRTRAMPLTPGLLGDALGIALEPDVSVRRLLRLVSREQVLAVRVLRMANVAASAPMREVTSIDTAVLRLGTRAVQRAVLAACFVSWSNPDKGYGPGGRAIVHHGIATANLARLLALRVGCDPEEAFAQGLLHDVGKLFLLRLHAEFIRNGGRPLTLPELHLTVVERHAEVGGMAMQYWGLPDVIREPVRWHHEPTNAPGHPRAAAVTYAANLLSHRHGLGCEMNRTIDPGADPVCVALGVTPEMIEEFDHEALAVAEMASKALQ